ncbi:hypothetical protein O6H91_01G144200 [Diphasiastrum complanatum]|uniref:Uncharacterized protein n=1 Tax=Diphasiastrum complanatum TaxID=34168 RepID=A0ACC2EXB5_DIPCM|nr:hypothetical protein O6H91_01G144200 [Diphasiastrum complanatum]
MENNDHPLEILADGLAMLRQMEATKMMWKVEAKANANAAAASVGNKIQNGCEDSVLLFPAEQKRYPILTNSLPSRGSFGPGCILNPGRKDQHYAEHQTGRTFCLDVGSSTAKEWVATGAATFQENSNQVLIPTSVSSDSSIFSKAWSSRPSRNPHRKV